MMGDDDHDRSRDRQRGGGRRDRPTRFSSTERDRSADRGRDRGGMKSSNNRVYVSNIPYEYRWQDLKDLFRQQVGEVAFVELFVDENDKARGCGIVEFADASSAKKCLEVMHRYDLKGRKMVIKEDYGNKRDKYGNLIGNKSRRDTDNDRGDRSERGGGGGGGGGSSRDMMDRHSNMGSGGGGTTMSFNGNTYGLSSAFLEDLNIQTPLNSRIFVANLDYKVDKKKLKEVFRLAGKVLYVDMPLAKDGTSRGFAVVEFDHPVEAVQAISMFQGQALYERAMTVRMDRGSDREKLPDGLKSVGPGLGSNGEALRDVARNLPTVSNPVPMVASAQSVHNSGAGILGAVPNLQTLGGSTNALTSLGGLGSSAAVLQQAAQLGLSNNLLAGSLGAANLLQSNPSLAALATGGGGGSINSTHGGSGGNSFRGDGHDSGSGRFISTNNSSLGGNNGGYDGGSQSNVARNSYSTGGYDSKPPGGFGGFDGDKAPGGGFGGFSSGDRDRFSMNNGGNQLMRNSMNMVDRKKCQLLISNLPPSAQYKLITEKCQEFGAVVRFEEQGVGSLLVTFQTEWDAEQAMKNIDRARIDGRTIDAQII